MKFNEYNTYDKAWFDERRKERAMMTDCKHEWRIVHSHTGSVYVGCDIQECNERLSLIVANRRINERAELKADVDAMMKYHLAYTKAFSTDDWVTVAELSAALPDDVQARLRGEA